jgi:hypothetical protein
MALNDKSRRRPWLPFHFLLRCAGLTGLVAVAVGLVLASLEIDLGSWETVRQTVLAPQHWKSWDDARDALLERPNGTPVAVPVGLLVGGALLALLALLVEGIAALRQAAGRRSAFGFNVVLQIALAVVLLVGLNLFSYSHYLRYDWTRPDANGNRMFTLPQAVRDQLSALKGDTTIVVYQRHKTFGQLSDKPDAYDYAAERKVVEKVKDLVDQFRELGPQFKVTVLDVEEEGYQAKLDGLIDDLAPQFAARAQEESPEVKNEDFDKLTQAKAKEIRAALDVVPENSVFFFGPGTMQRLSFNGFYQLDKTASQDADEGRGNLVLLYQGVEPFARKVLNIDQKRPRIAVAVVHEVLGLDGSEELGMAGVKKVLTAHGFDSRDIILKKWSEFAPPEPAVFTYDESKFERLDEQFVELETNIKNLEQDIKDLKEVLNLWTTSTLDDLTKKYADQLKGRKITEAIRRQNLAELKTQVAFRGFMLDQQREERDAVAKDKSGLNVDNLAEQRRIADLKAKTDRILADCDLLIVPRMTLFNVARGEMIPNRVYKLDDAQVAGIKDFLKAGKPVLFCFGPINESPRSMGMDPSSMGPDKLEDALTDLGIKMSHQTVLFNVESKSFAERRGGLLVLGANVEVPPVEFDWPPGAGRPTLMDVDESRPPNPIRESLRLTARSLGKDQLLNLRIRHPRPVYFEAPKDVSLPFQPDFMMTSPASWNEANPFPTPQRTPRYEPPAATDFTKGTLDEKRRGPFPIGIAVETRVPAAWSTDKDAKPANVRLAAIGQGGVFIGQTLPPVKEKLLLDTCNWLLGRDDLLTNDKHPWQYPRVELTEREQTLWQWGTRLGLPVAFAYLGLMVLMVRRLR